MVISAPIQIATIGMGDSLLLLVLALVVFGPRRLPQIGRQIGKLMYEFRKASNDFKFQMEEELRNADEADRRKREEAERQRALTEAQAAAAQAQTAAAQAMNAAAQAQGAAQAAQNAADSQPPDAAGAGAAAAGLNASASREPDAGPVENGLRVQPPSTGERVEATRPGRARGDAIAAEAADQVSSQASSQASPQAASAPEAASAADSPEAAPNGAVLTEACGQERSTTEPTAQHG